MAYNNQKGSQHTGDIQYEGDPNDVQIDFENDQIILKTGGAPRVSVINTEMSASGIFRNVGSISGSGDVAVSGAIHAANFYGDGSGLTSIAAGTDTQIQFNDGGSAFGASANLTWDDTNFQVVGNISGSGTVEIGDNLTGSNIVPNTTLTHDLGSTDLEWSRLYVEEVIGDIEGAIRFDAVNDEGDAISKGQVVYIKGVSGQTPTIALAAADDANKMPAFGLAGSNAANGASVQVVTFGSLQNLNLSSLFPDETFAEGDPVFVQTGSGGVSGSLTAVRPLGAANLIQNVGQVVRNGGGGDNQIKVGGAGRSNATPNLDKGYLFVGDDTNCSTPDNTVFISSSASRVGINTTNPGAALDVSGSVYITGPDALVSGSKGLFNLNDGTLQVGTEEVGTGVAVKIRSDVDSGVPLLVKSPSHEVILACTGSGKVTVGGVHLDAKMNISGSDTDKLISATGETRSPAFYVSASGETFVSGNLILQNIDPVIHFSNSAGIGLGTIGYNSSDNILIQNETANKHIVLKANDAGTLREGFRLDGAVPEVVVNQTSDSLVNFRVESNNNTHMIYVAGASDKVGINNSNPSETLSVVGNVSSSALLHAQGSATFGATVTATGSVSAAGLYSTGLISGSNGLHVDAPATFGATVSVTGAISVGIPVAKTALDVHHNPTTLTNDTGGGEVVKFGTGTLTTGKLYYLHSGSSWEQADIIGEASGGLGMLGIALGSNPAVDGMLLRGFFDVNTYLSGAFVAGTTVYMSAPGYITTMRPSASNEVVRVLGTCTTTGNVIYFNPSPDYLVIT